MRAYHAHGQCDAKVCAIAKIFCAVEVSPTFCGTVRKFLSLSQTHSQKNVRDVGSAVDTGIWDTARLFGAKMICRRHVGRRLANLLVGHYSLTQAAEGFGRNSEDGFEGA